MGTTTKNLKQSSIDIDLEDILHLMSSGFLYQLVQVSTPADASNRSDILCQQLAERLNAVAVLPYDFLVQFISPNESPITIDEIEYITSLLSASIKDQLIWGAANNNDNTVTVQLILPVSENKITLI